MAGLVAVPTGTPNMRAEIDGAIGWMIFDKPEKRNAVSLDMWEAMPGILAKFEADPAVRVVVLKGMGGKSFVSGADISQFEKARSTEDGNLHYDRLSDAAIDALGLCPKPAIAMIQGWCISGGLAIAAGCDLRVASPDSRFGIPAARLGVGYGAAGVKKLMALVGPAFTKEIFFTARHFSAQEAAAMGVVNRIAPEGGLEEYVRNLCALIAENAPLTMAALKRTVGELSRGHEANLACCDEMARACFASEDYVEGRTAFMEKRRPVFRGV